MIIFNKNESRALFDRYVGVGEQDDLQLFYYFVESERNPVDDPVLIWITGGPGCAALRPFFNQLGKNLATTFFLCMLISFILHP